MVDYDASNYDCIEDFIDGSGIVECPDCGEIVEMEFDEVEEIDKCPYCHNGKYMYGDI